MRYRFSIILVFLFFVTNTSVRADNTKKIGICLSGGGALGFAHIGALQALEDNGIYPDAVSGSSMGAIIGAMYAAGYSPSEILEIVKTDQMYKTTKLLTWIPSLTKTGVSTHESLRNVIKELIPHNSFDKLNLPFFVCVSNLNVGEYEIVSTGEELDTWVAASASIPGVFEAIQVNDIYYVDGGLLNNFPAQALEKATDVIIGVDVLPYMSVKRDLTKTSEVIIRSIRASQKENSKQGHALCKYVIESEAVENWNEFSFENYAIICNYGYQAAVKYIKDNPDIRQLSSKERPKNRK